MRIPQALADDWREDPAWLAALPELVAACASRWGLRLEEPFESAHALVAPAGEVVLKLNAPSHRDADHEADALAHWAGAGAVRLVERDDARRALLLERCRPGTPLRDSPADEARVLAELLPRLWGAVEPGQPFGLLAEEAARWLEQVPRAWELGGRPFERELVEVALATFESVDRSASALVNQDLHGGNVLRAGREPWLAIDPKPLVGEREANAVGPLRNAAFDGGRSAVRRVLDAFAAHGLDRERARAWGVAHALAWGWRGAAEWSQRSVEAARAIHAA